MYYVYLVILLEQHILIYVFIYVFNLKKYFLKKVMRKIINIYTG